MGTGMTKVMKFTSDGNAINLDLGFIPDHVRVINTAAADTEVAVLEWFYGMGDQAEIWWMNSDAGEQNFYKKTSTDGYIAAYDTSTVMGNRISCTFDDTGGASEDLITCTEAAGHGLKNGEAVKVVASGGLPTNLSELTKYYVIDATATTFRISTTKGGSAVDFGSDGTPPNYVFSIDKLGVHGSEGGKGISIETTFMDDGDVVYVYATKADEYVDLGDVA